MVEDEEIELRNFRKSPVQTCNFDSFQFVRKIQHNRLLNCVNSNTMLNLGILIILGTSNNTTKTQKNINININDYDAEGWLSQSKESKTGMLEC